MFLMMMSWKRQVPRGTKCYLKNQNYVIRKKWKKLRVNENPGAKDSERKTMNESEVSESEVNERETFTDRSMDTDSLSTEIAVH
jgi:hypothetical protein